MTEEQLIKVAFRSSQLINTVTSLGQAAPQQLGNVMRNVTPKAKAITGGMSDKWKNGLQLAGVGLAGNIVGKNQGYGTGYDQGASTGYQAGVGQGYGQGFGQAASQAQNTGFLNRLMGNYNFQAQGPQVGDPNAVAQMLASNDPGTPGWLRRLTGAF